MFMHTTSDKTILVDRGDGKGTQTVDSIDSLIKLGRETGNSVTSFQVLGTPGNAGLISAVYEELAMKNLAILKIAGPAGLTIGDIASPEHVLAHLKRVEAPASVGGFHTARLCDYISYSLVDELNSGNKEKAYELGMLHPAFPAMNFVGVPIDTAVSIMRYMIDPRWFVDPLKPDRKNRLMSYFGISEGSMGAIGSNNELKKAKLYKNYIKATIAFSAWQEEHETNFLLRDYKMFLSTGMPASKAKAIITQDFLEFVSDTWLQSIVPETWEVFVPKYFFRSADAAEAYTTFRNGYPARYT